MLVIAAGLVLGVLMIPINEAIKKRSAARTIQRRVKARRLSQWRRYEWRNRFEWREEPTSVMGRTTAWDHHYYPDNYHY